MARNPAHSDLWTKTKSSEPTRDNGATVLMGGNIDDTDTVTASPGGAILGAGRKPQPGPVENASVGTTKANDSGVFAVLKPNHYVVKGGNITSELAGVAYRGLRGGNQNQIRGLHTLLTRKTVLITSWNYATGVPTFGGGNPSDDDFDLDGDFAEPTRALPGSVVVIDAGAGPNTVNLESKTG